MQKLLWLMGTLSFTLGLAILVHGQESLLPVLQALRQEYPSENLTHAQLGEYLNRVAWIGRADGWGLHRKDSGTRCPQPRGVTVGCDILVHGSSWSVYDVLLGSEEQAEPAWNWKGPINNPANFVPPTAPDMPEPPPPDPPAPPAPPPGTPVDLAPILTAIADLRGLMRQDLDRSEQTFQDLRAIVLAVDARVKAHDENPSWIRRYWNDLLMVIGPTLGTWVTCRQTEGC